MFRESRSAIAAARGDVQGRRTRLHPSATKNSCCEKKSTKGRTWLVFDLQGVLQPLRTDNVLELLGNRQRTERSEKQERQQQCNRAKRAWTECDRKKPLSIQQQQPRINKHRERID